jgi:hypothetical protein
VFSKGVAAKNAFQPQPSAGKNAIFLDRQPSVFRATGSKPAGCGPTRRRRLVHPNQFEDDSLSHRSINLSLARRHAVCSSVKAQALAFWVPMMIQSKFEPCFKDCCLTASRIRLFSLFRFGLLPIAFAVVMPISPVPGKQAILRVFSDSNRPDW